MNPTVAILAGGLATRLRGVAGDTPKCLAPVNGKPFLHYLFRQIATAGFSDVVLLVGHLAEQVEQFARDGAAYGLQVRYSHEIVPLGTGGAIRNARNLLTDPSLVLNGDTITDIDLNSLLRYHIAASNALVTLSLCEIDDISDYGNVVINEQSEVMRFEEKQALTVAGLVNAGVYALSPAALNKTQDNTKYSLETQLLPDLLRSSGVVKGFRCPGQFLDIGTPERLLLAQRHPLFHENGNTAP